MVKISAILIAGVGGFIGTILRLMVSYLPLNFSGKFPLATFLVNVIGSFIIGIFYGIFKDDDYLKLLLITGFCGGFTTFSSFSWEIFTLFEEGKYFIGIVYATLSLVLGLLFVFIGLKFTELWIKN